MKYQKKLFFIGLIILIIILGILIILFCSNKINIEYYSSVESNIENKIIRDWYIIQGDIVKEEIEKQLNIELPNINFVEKNMYISIGRKIKKIRYNLIFKPFMCHKSFNPVFMNVYPGFITMSKEYYNGQIFIYLGDNTKIIDDELCKVTLFYE